MQQIPAPERSMRFAALQPRRGESRPLDRLRAQYDFDIWLAWRRMNAFKAQRFVRLPRGEELVSRKLGVMAAELITWRGIFLAAGEASLKMRPLMVATSRSVASRPRSVT